MAYTVLAKFDIQTILDLIASPVKHTMLDGRKVKVSGDRLTNFLVNGVDCICCGIKGSHFNLETNAVDKVSGMHLNLYAKNKHGHYVLMTKDHAVLKSLGGSDTVSNYNPMCIKCNNLRGNKYPVLSEFLEDYKNGLVGEGRGNVVKVNNHKTPPTPGSKRQLLKAKLMLRAEESQIKAEQHVVSFYINSKKNETIAEIAV